ncbi:MAG: hypothetical protein OEU54_01935 [Gemmatimonadota bacterium]|nr:hypothetical protein [Gemmatimonadota bacterium]
MSPQRFARSLIRVVSVVALAAFTGLTGCFQMEYAVELEEDLSGEVAFDLMVDLDRMAYGVAAVQKSFMGDDGSPTDEEVEASRQELLDQVDSGVLEEDNLRAEIDPDLPPGVTLLETTQRRDGLRTEVSMRLAFDHLTSLNAVDFGADGGGGPDAEPFAGIELVDEGDTFVLRNEPMNPLEEVEDEAGGMDGMDGLIEMMFQDLSVAFVIAAPFEIVEHNASSREGDRLRWVYDYEALAAGLDNRIFVRYRK